MKTHPPPRIRCVIYTRVSTDQGLDQDFNSLDAQREAAEAFIKSQMHEGWSAQKSPYDDGGFSGGTLNRPALQRLLVDIKAGLIDTVVVYKVDRLTRSLADFAKLVELFDAHKVSFVSVTQSFNTTTSMGRLTLNVLLSFAQFEREVTSERIRDKIGASKRKGLWVGGMVPLGYASVNKKLVVVPEEAERVRLIFQRYRDLGSLDKVLSDLHARGIATKQRQLSSGKVQGGIPFTRGGLAYLLRNRFYVGEILYKGSICPAEHEPILAREMFEAVQAHLDAQRIERRGVRRGGSALLAGKIFDDQGHTMTPSHARKKGVRYDYYLSSAMAHGRAGEAGSLRRVAARQIEPLVTGVLRAQCLDAGAIDNRVLIDSYLLRCQLSATEMTITYRPQGAAATQTTDESNADAELPLTMTLPWSPQVSRRARDILIPRTALAHPSPLDGRARSQLVRAIARGRRWLDEIVEGSDVQAIAEREGCTGRSVMQTLSLAFVCPDLVTAAVEGRLPKGIGFARLAEPPMEWSQQLARLGL
jgi:site-specific DNA recombinase